MTEAIERLLIAGAEAKAVLGTTDHSLVDTSPKNAYCKHCGKRFAGARFSTICPDCKGAGHTLAPAECPQCNEARGI